MPELPEVELIVRDLNMVAAGRKITYVRVLWPGYIEGVPAKQMDKTLAGEVIKNVERRGKFILFRLTHWAMLNHLRMTGKIIKQHAGEGILKHSHVVLRLDDGFDLVFSDVRKFGRLRVFPVDETDQKLESLSLGLEPFDSKFTGKRLASIFAGRKKSIKNVLLDQTLIAGIGNIYACEILFSSRTNPFKPAGLVADGDITRIVRATRSVLNRAIAHGGSSISDYRRVNGQQGGMQDRFKVYGREGEYCLRCGDSIRREIQVGRSTFWCPSCQQ